MGDLVELYRDFYQDAAGDEPLVDGTTARVLATDWADRPSKTGSPLFFVFDTRYRLIDPEEAVEKWLSHTRDTWSRLSLWKLCDDCRAAGLGATHRDHLHQLSTAYPPFQEPKEDGDCDFCHLLVHATPAFIQERIAQRSQQNSRLDNLDQPLKLVLFMPNLRSPISMGASLILGPPNAGEGDAKEGKESLDGYECFSIYLSFEKDRIPREPESALLPVVLDFLRKNLHDCFEDHAKCRLDEGLHHDWPSRVLRITEGTIFLVDFHPDMACRYAALSYCWGSPEELSRHPPLRATRATLQELRDGIQLDELPRTIEQAAKICIHLGIQYIWVDALCIIQDDGLDWEKESQKMATVYSEARVTLIAASSTSCHSGFLDMDLGGMVLDTPPLALGSSTRIVGRLASNRGYHKDEFAPPHSLVLDPIDDRGWTLQEQILSTRYIRFTQNDVQWECHSTESCLCAQRPRTSPWIKTHPRQWVDIPGHFNHRKFTLASDKLRALSGLAKACQRATLGDVYLAGMWKNMLLDTMTYPGQLYWRCSPREPEPCYDIYLAPSFSWASVPSTLTSDSAVWGLGEEQELINLPVKSYLSRLLCKVVDAGTVPLSASDPLGPVTDGFLTLRAPLVACMVSSLDGRTFSVTSTPDFTFTVEPFFCRFDCVVTRIELPDGTFTVARSQHRRAFLTTEVTIALLRTVSTDDDIGSPTIGVEGLILGKSFDRDGYQRLGYIQIKPLVDIDAMDWSERVTEITIY